MSNLCDVDHLSTLAIFGRSGLFNLRQSNESIIAYSFPSFNKVLLIFRPVGYTNDSGYCAAYYPIYGQMDKTQALCVPPHNLDLGNGQLGEAEYPSRDKPNTLRESFIGS